MLKRTLEKTIDDVSQHFPVLLIAGPRQVGKTTLLEHCASISRQVVSLDDLDLRHLAQNDPALFLQRYQPPLLIDEVQYAPELFTAIKQIVDKERKNGLFWLTGSQKFHLMHNISESLAGRVAILDMLGLSRRELTGHGHHSTPFLPTQQWVEEAKAHVIPAQNSLDIYNKIWRGQFPALAKDPDTPRDIFYNSYIQTYIQRDVQQLTAIGDEQAFYTFLQAVAARTAQLLNYADLARDCGIDQKTAKAWLSLLETSGLVYILQPYHNNLNKRLVKTPKLYFLDTGLCSYLTRWTSPEALEAGAMTGAILETYMFTEILKSYWHNGKQAPFYFYRDKDQKEVDLLIEENQTLHPIEFKKTATPSASQIRPINTLNRLDKPIGPGAIICLKEQPVPLSEQMLAIPVTYL